jgi:HEAT repeat protein
MSAASASAFATHFARLLSQRIREPDNVDAHNMTLGELAAANSEPVVLKWVDWHLTVGDAVFPPTAPQMLEHITPMAGHGIRELTFDPKTDRAHLLGTIWILSSAPAISDGGAAAMSQFRLLGANTVHATSVVASAMAGTGPTTIPTPTAPKRLTQTFEVSPKSMLDQLTDALDPVDIPISTAMPAMPSTQTPPTPRQITTSADRPPAEYVPLRFQEQETAESLVSRFVNATATDDIVKALEAMATYSELRPKKLDETVTILLALIAGEFRLTAPDARRTFGVAMKRIGRSTIMRALAGAMATTPERRDEYMRIFAYFGEPAADQMVEALVTAESSKERRILFDALVELRRGIPALIYMLSDGRWYVARNAAELLGELRAVAAEERLIWWLKHADARVRRSAAVALAKLQTPGSREALKGALMDESPDVRLAASHGLATDRDRGSVGQVLRALAEEKDPDVQRTLLLALGKMGTPDAIEKLVEIAEPDTRIFKKKPTALRVAAVIALAESNSVAALAAVRRFVNDREAEVRAAATKSLTPARGSTALRQEW